MDRFGRKPMFEIYMAGALVFGVGTFQTLDAGVELPLLCLAIFFGLGSVSMTSAFATEPFPTYVRSRAAAWCRNAFEIVGGVRGSLVRRALACVLLALAFTACTQAARPEGVVENWLRSLNQGAAGRPDRYAPDEVSQRVVPG